MKAQSLLTVPLESLSKKALQDLKAEIDNHLEPVKKDPFGDFCEYDFVHYFWNDMATKKAYKDLEPYVKRVEESILVTKKVEISWSVYLDENNCALTTDHKTLAVEPLNNLDTLLSLDTKTEKELLKKYKKHIVELKKQIKLLYDKNKSKIKEEFGFLPKISFLYDYYGY